MPAESASSNSVLVMFGHPLINIGDENHFPVWMMISRTVCLSNYGSVELFGDTPRKCCERWSVARFGRINARKQADVVGPVGPQHQQRNTVILLRPAVRNVLWGPTHRCVFGRWPARRYPGVGFTACRDS